MRRFKVLPRADFAACAAKIGFDYATVDGQPYWDESAAYAFTLRQIEDDIEAPSEELAALCVDVVSRLIGDEAALRKLAVPQHAWELIAASWKAGHPSLYGRFDLAYDGRSPAKLLEYNADTPTSLFEAAVVQWFWLENLKARRSLPAAADQYNSIHDKLIARWREVAAGRFVHLAGIFNSAEDYGNLAYLNECALQAGLTTKMLDMGDVGLNAEAAPGFIDRDGRTIDFMFKLYPWEWLLADEFGSSAAMKAARFVEPAWKMLMSNKGFLAYLWAAEPNHPNLLPCFFESDMRVDEVGPRYARKPLYSREGANITLQDQFSILAKTSGNYGAEGYVRQKLHLLPVFNGKRPVIGSWMIGDKAAGMGIREDNGPITTDRSCFVPHIILD